MLKNAKILIVDDEIDVLESIKDSLGVKEYQIDVEMNSEKALKKIENNFYDLVITDLMMPKVSGVDIVQAVRSTQRDTLVIVVTGYASVETAIKSLKFGVYDYVQKPIINVAQIVERALEKLYLERKNKELGNQIKEMLSKISLLHDISTILYQVTDFDEASEMILDTLTEGLKINNVGLLHSNNHSSYKLVKYRGIPSTAVEKIQFSSLDTINNIKLSSDQATIIKELAGKLNISNAEVPVNESFKHCIITPINFHYNLLGYIIAFLNEKEIIDSENIIKLLKIFSTQISPKLYSFSQQTTAVTNAENMVLQCVAQKIKEADSLLAPISFALFRIVLLNTPKELSLLNDYLSVIKNIMTKHIENSGELTWLTRDTALFAYPAIDIFGMEDFCIKLVNDVEQLQMSGNKKSLVTIKYSCVSYPQSESSPDILTQVLWKNLFEELEKSLKTEHYKEIN